MISEIRFLPGMKRYYVGRGVAAHAKRRKVCADVARQRVKQAEQAVSVENRQSLSKAVTIGGAGQQRGV